MPLRHPVLDYFDFDDENHKSICKIKGCKHPILKGKHASNLYRHFEKTHREQHGALKERRVLY